MWPDNGRGPVGNGGGFNKSLGVEKSSSEHLLEDLLWRKGRNYIQIQESEVKIVGLHKPNNQPGNSTDDGIAVILDHMKLQNISGPNELNAVQKWEKV